MINPHTNEFAAFWAKNFDTPCPPVPKKLDDLSITAREAMRMENPILFQNLFRQQDINQMPADVAGRMQNQTFWASDIPILRQFGYEHQARELEKQIEEGRRVIMEQKIEASRQRTAANEKRLKEWQNMSPMQKMLMNPPSPEAVQRCREQWGIDGRADWER